MRLDPVPRTECYRVLPPDPPLRAEGLLRRKFDSSEVVPGCSIGVPLGGRVLYGVLGRVGCELRAESIGSRVGGVVVVQVISVECLGRIKRGGFIDVGLLWHGGGGERDMRNIRAMRERSYYSAYPSQLSVLLTLQSLTLSVKRIPNQMVHR